MSSKHYVSRTETIVVTLERYPQLREYMKVTEGGFRIIGFDWKKINTFMGYDMCLPEQPIGLDALNNLIHKLYYERPNFEF